MSDRREARGQRLDVAGLVSDTGTSAKLVEACFREMGHREVRGFGGFVEACTYMTHNTICPAGGGDHLFLYDGVCGLCNRVNRFILRHDRQRRFDFAPLQSSTGASLLERHSKRADALDTFYVAVNYRSAAPVLLGKARGAMFVAQTLGWPWKVIAVFDVLPSRVLDAAYDLVARHRYRLFGRYDACSIPAPEHRRRFIDG